MLRATFRQAKADQVTLLAAGVAFFALLAMVPSLVAFVSLYGLLADPADVSGHVASLLGTAPVEVQELVQRQLAAVTERSSSTSGVGFIVGVVVALWSASSGMRHLIGALNTAHNVVEGRSYLRVRLLALMFTLGAIALSALTVTALTVLPALGDNPVLDAPTAAAIAVARLLRWPLLAGLFAAMLAVMFRFAPSRDQAASAAEQTGRDRRLRGGARRRLVTPGVVVATGLWLAASAALSAYVTRFGSYDETYGTLAGAVVATLWLFVSAYVTLLGAELDAEIERRSDHDRARRGPGGAAVQLRAAATASAIRSGC